MRRRSFHRSAPIFLALLVSCMMCVFVSCTGETANGNGNTALPADGETEIHFLDVGQADCTLLISQGEAVLIDAGNQGDDDFIIGYLNQLGIDRIKYVIFTHPHEDHIGAGERIIANFQVEKIYTQRGYTEGIEGNLEAAIDASEIPAEYPAPGEEAGFGECRIQFIGPVDAHQDVNDQSICLKISHGENDILLTGDAGAAPEKDMIEAGFDLEAELFKAGHHGSSTSNSYYFLREANPRYVVVSCEKDNMYGHPHEEAMSRFNDLGAEVFRTDLQGTVIAVSDGSRLTFNCEGKKADRPYTEEPEEANYIGNANSKKYHLPTCGGLPKEENRVYFMTTDAAQQAGYDPCGNCNP